MDEKLKGVDYVTRPYLELQSHPDFDVKVWYGMVRILDLTTDELQKINLRGLD